MNKLVLRIFGIIFFVFAVTVALPVLSQNLAAFIFFISSSETGWGLYYLFTGLLFVSFFVFAVFSSGTAAIFAGSGGYTQSVWNCGIFSIFCLGLFTTLMLITGVSEEEQEILLVSEIALLCLVAWNAIVFFCIKKTEGFYWKNLLSKDSCSLLCLKVYAGMTVVIEIASFLLAHKFVE